jgi:hypothetical protein
MEKLFDKYAVTAKMIELRLTASSKQLATFLGELGYE